jgi:hypothetical protein
LRACSTIAPLMWQVSGLEIALPNILDILVAGKRRKRGS